MKVLKNPTKTSLIPSGGLYPHLIEVPILSEKLITEHHRLVARKEELGKENVALNLN